MVRIIPILNHQFVETYQPNNQKELSQDAEHLLEYIKSSRYAGAVYSEPFSRQTALAANHYSHINSCNADDFAVFPAGSGLTGNSNEEVVNFHQQIEENTDFELHSRQA